MNSYDSILGFMFVIEDVDKLESYSEILKFLRDNNLLVPDEDDYTKTIDQFDDPAFFHETMNPYDLLATKDNELFDTEDDKLLNTKDQDFVIYEAPHDFMDNAMFSRWTRPTYMKESEKWGYDFFENHEKQRNIQIWYFGIPLYEFDFRLDNSEEFDHDAYIEKFTRVSAKIKSLKTDMNSRILTFQDSCNCCT